MSSMTPEEGRAYLERWELLRKVEAAELRNTPMDAKLRKLAALMESRGAFGIDPRREAEARVVRERWERIKRSTRG
jgi:hypothetical protein